MTTRQKKEEKLLLAHQEQKQTDRLTWAAAHSGAEDLVNGVSRMLRCYTRK